MPPSVRPSPPGVGKPPMVVALTQSNNRLHEYADDEDHATFLVDELVPLLEEHYPLIGTPEQIVDGMNDLIEMGIDGILVSWVDYKTECKQWIDEIMPLMEQAGQREAFKG